MESKYKENHKNYMTPKTPIYNIAKLQPLKTNGLSAVVTTVSTTPTQSTTTTAPNGGRNVNSPVGVVQLGINKPITKK